MPDSSFLVSLGDFLLREQGNHFALAHQTADGSVHHSPQSNGFRAPLCSAITYPWIRGGHPSSPGPLTCEKVEAQMPANVHPGNNKWQVIRSASLCSPPLQANCLFHWKDCLFGSRGSCSLGLTCIKRKKACEIQTKCVCVQQTQKCVWVPCWGKMCSLKAMSTWQILE